MKRRYTLEVKGVQSKWGFTIEADPRHVKDWRADGLVVDELVNTIPAWLPVALTRLWCAAQDAFYFRNPFRR